MHDDAGRCRYVDFQSKVTNTCKYLYICIYILTALECLQCTVMTKVIKNDRLPQYHLTAPCVPVLPVPASAVGTITRPGLCLVSCETWAEGEERCYQNNSLHHAWGC